MNCYNTGIFYLHTMNIKKMNECLWAILAFWSLHYNTVSLRFRCFFYPPFPRTLDIRESLLLSIHFFAAIAISFHIENSSILKFERCFVIFMVSVFIVKAKIYDALERPLGFSPSKRNAALKTMVVSLQLTRNSLWNINCTRNIR